MTPAQEIDYYEYVENFDPTPTEYGGDYLYPLSFDDWLEQGEPHGEEEESPIGWFGLVKQMLLPPT